jgi:type II secretory pathway pseudopilin PulG
MSQKVKNPVEEQWIQQALRQAPWRTQTQATSLVLAVVVLVAVIGALYLAQASRTAATGRRLQALEARRQVIEQQNAQLRAEIASLRSVPRLTAEAERLGYHTASLGQVEYLNVPDVPPLPEPPPPPPIRPEEVVPRYNETLEGWLSEQLAVFRVQATDFWRRTFGSPANEPATPADDEDVETDEGEITATPGVTPPPGDGEDVIPDA